jgi:hypothetical protein
MRSHPLTTLKRSVRKFADFWGLEREYLAALQRGIYSVPDWFKGVSIAAVLASYVAVAVLACFGVFNTRWTDWRAHMPGLLALIWICGIHTVVFGHSRYHLPVMPVVIIYAAAAVHQRAWTRVHGSASWSAAVSAVVVLLAVWGYEVLVRDADRVRTLFATQ